jgi:hypothetical protein
MLLYGAVAEPHVTGMHWITKVASASTVQLLFAFTVSVAVVPEDVTEHEPPVTPPPWLTIAHPADETTDPFGQT